MASSHKDDDWLDFHPSPTKPVFNVPPGSVDAHCHVFGPAAHFPFSARRKYTPCDASKDTLWQRRDFLGFERNVIVQASCHGTDNSAMIDAVRTSNGLARGVAVVGSRVTDEELHDMNEAGVRAVRFNFVKRLVDVPPRDALLDIAQRIKALGWHIVIYFEEQDLVEYFDFFSSLPTVVVVDHMGRPDVSKPVEGAAFDLFVRLLQINENIWSKVSCPERLSVVGPPDYTDVLPFARRLVEAFPDRVLWGTDWPHPNMKSHMPDDGRLVDIIPKIAPTQAQQLQLLVNNPMRLYWPGEQV